MQVVRDCLDEIGLTTREYSPHSLRHTTAIAILEAGGNIFEVQTVLGHASPEVYPLKGLVKLEEICSMVAARLNPGIGITGVIVTMYNPTKNLFVSVDEKLRQRYGDKVFATRIRENVKLAECPMHRTPVTDYDKVKQIARDNSLNINEVIDVALDLVIETYEKKYGPITSSGSRVSASELIRSKKK